MMQHRATLDAILEAAREAGIEGMDAVEPPFSRFPFSENDGVTDYILLAPDFGEHSPWTVYIGEQEGATKPGVLPCAMQVAEIGDGVVVARLVALFRRPEDPDRTHFWRPLGDFQETPSPALSPISDWEDWLLGIEQCITGIPAALMDRAAEKTLVELHRSNMRLQVLYPLFRFDWLDDSDNPVNPGHRVWLEDDIGREIYSAWSLSPVTALDVVTAWAWRTLIILPDCEAEA